MGDETIDNVVGRRTSTGTDSLLSEPRAAGIDVLRGCAVLGMILAHMVRVVPETPGASRVVSQAVRLVEPAVSASFLMLVGVSLGLSWRRRNQWTHWHARNRRRAGTLYLVGMVLFALQHGLQFPDGLFSPDVLGVIAWALVMVSVVLPFRQGPLWLAVGVLALSWVLERYGLAISGVNGGPGGVIPLVAFACLGAWWLPRLNLDRSAPRDARWWLALLVVVVMSSVAQALPGAMTQTLRSVYSTSEQPQTLWFWNHSFKGTLTMAGPLLLLLLAFTSWSELWQRPLFRVLRVVGRHSLSIYVGHLFALGAMARWAELPAGLAGLSCVAGVLLLLAVGVLLLLESERMQSLHARVARTLGVRL